MFKAARKIMFKAARKVMFTLSPMSKMGGIKGKIGKQTSQEKKLLLIKVPSFRARRHLILVLNSKKLNRGTVKIYIQQRKQNMLCVVIKIKEKKYLAYKFKFNRVKKGASHFIGTQRKKMSEALKRNRTKITKVFNRKSLAFKKILKILKQFLLIIIDNIYKILLIIIATVSLNLIISEVFWFIIIPLWCFFELIIEIALIIIKVTCFINRIIIEWGTNTISILPLELRVVIKILVLVIICTIIRYFINARPIANTLSRLGFGDDYDIIVSRKFKNEFYYEPLLGDSLYRSQLIKIVVFQEALLLSALLPPFAYLYKPVFNFITSCKIPRSELHPYVSFFYEQIFNFLTFYTNSLKNIVFRSGFTDTIENSTFFVEENFVYVNKKRMPIPDLRCFPDDIIEIDARIVFPPLNVIDKIPEPRSYYYNQIFNYFYLNTLRLENMVSLLKWADTISASKKLVKNGFISVNNEQITDPCYRCRPGDIITIDTTVFIEQIPEPHPYYNKMLAVLSILIIILQML